MRPPTGNAAVQTGTSLSRARAAADSPDYLPLWYTDLHRLLWFKGLKVHLI